ncbi:uncharacterized protein LOC130389630 isoform X2 [Gadus chalcogrammus]|uniref:uncharacterized protein LOC130389630 isoform X2 n=1 Tax=Gadus chalcogrammus TaxID=1042646 RepID=UPI0024C4A0EE|nr:uncharacterized protein LOC130389630 isoform X2 [Gadus chalcogrammus]
MDLAEGHPPHTTIRQENLEQELSVSYVPCQVESGGAFSLQVLEFKTCLLEAVEELQIRRDAEIRFGQQINKLVLEKQELEWQKEQKLALQSRSKDSHLRQLREVENRFGGLSRLCAAVKQAHSRLERDVDEAMRMNKKLTSINEKHESTINSFMQELEDTNGKLIKVQVSSMFDPGNSRLTAKEQHADRLQQRLLMETERNRKLKEENATERADKQELMRSLQVAQQLLQCQTSALTRLQTELHLLTEQHQALKRDHEATRALGDAAEHRAAAVTEDHATSRTLWEKERAVLLESLEREQRDHGSMRATYDRLCQEQSGRSSQTSPGPEIADDGKAHDITTPLCRAVEARTGPGSLLESSPGSELPRLGSEGGCVPSQTGDPDSVVVSDELAVTRAMKGQEGSRYHPSQQPFESGIPYCLVATPVATRNLVGQDSLHGLGDSQTDSLSTEAPRPLTHECDPAPLADVIDNNVCLSDVGLLKNLKSFISGPENRSVYDDADLVGDMLTARERQPSEQEASALQGEGTMEHGEVPSALQAEGTREHQEGPSALQAEGTRELREGLSGNREDGCSRPGIHSSGPEDAGERLTEDAVETRDAVLEDREGTDRTKAGQEEEERLDVEAEGLGSLARSPGTEIGRVTSGDKAQRDGELSDALQGIDPPERTEPPAPPLPLEVSGIRAYTSNLATDSGAAAPVAPNAGPHHSCDVESGTASDWETSSKESAHPVDVPPEHGNQPTMCGFPLSSTLPDYPLSDSTIYQECSEAQDMVKNNVGNVADHSKTDKEISGRFDEPENEESVTGTRVVETHPPNKENSYVESTSKELSSSEIRGNQIPVRSPADVKDKTKREAPPADLSKVVTVDPPQDLPAVPCSALQNEEVNFDVNTTAGESKPRRQVREAEAAATEVVDDPSAERVLKPADRPSHESPPKTHGSVDGSVDAHILDHSVHCGNKKFRSSFEWTGFQTKKCLPSTAINVNQNRVPVTAAVTASSLPGAPSASRRRSPQKRDQRGDWKAIRQTFRATAAEDAEDGASLSFQLLPTSAPMESGHGSTTSAAPGPGTGSSAGLDLFPPSSPENQQSSLRAQISRIEQFLSTDRLRLAKRRRTEH